MAAVLKLRGLPWSATQQDIVNFFQPLPVGLESVTLVLGPDGRPSGEGFVWIHEANLGQAMGYNRKHIGSRYVEILQSNESEYTVSMQASGTPQAPGYTPGPKNPPGEQVASDVLIRVRGLPFSVAIPEVAQVFADYGVDDKSVSLGLTTAGFRAGSPSGEAFVRFQSVEDAQRALQSMQGVTLGSRYLELFASTENELEALQSAGGIMGFEHNLNSGGKSMDINPQVNRGNTGWVRLRGLPFSATQADVVQFFGSDFSVYENDVTIKYGSDGRPSGEAFVQLESDEAAMKATQLLDRKNIGPRFVEVFPSSFDECENNKKIKRKRSRRKKSSRNKSAITELVPMVKEVVAALPVASVGASGVVSAEEPRSQDTASAELSGVPVPSVKKESPVVRADTVGMGEDMEPRGDIE